MRILQSRSFEKKVRRFDIKSKKALDREIQKIVDNPLIGEEKRGDLRGVFVHKFRMRGIQYLLSYRFLEKDELELVMIGPHENYYRDLSHYLKSRS